MDIQKRFVGPCARPVDDEREIVIRGGDLATTLLLFENYTLESCKLLEFPQLIDLFGFDSVMELVKSRSLKIKCDVNLIVVLGETKELIRTGKWLEYDFTFVRAANHEEYTRRCRSKITTSHHLNRKQLQKLRGEIAVKIDKDAGKPPDVNSPELKAIRNFLQEASENHPNVKRACATELKERHGIKISPNDFSLIIHRLDSERLKAETDIPKLLNIDEYQTHEVIKYALLRMSSINDRFGLMERYKALTGLNDFDLPVFEGRYEFFAHEINPTKDINRLNRVMHIKGFPDFNELAERGQLKLDKILEIRETNECKEFREWLSGIDTATDEEIEERINSIRGRIGNFLGRITGKSVRFLVSTGLGFVPGGALIGLSASVVDTFLLEKFFPTSGPIAFLNKKLPSAFELESQKSKADLISLNIEGKDK